MGRARSPRVRIQLCHFQNQPGARRRSEILGRARAGEIVHFRTWTPGRSLAATRSRKLGDFDTYGRHEAVHRPPTALRRPRQDVKRPARAGARRKAVARQGKGCHRRRPRMRLDGPFSSLSSHPLLRGSSCLLLLPPARALGRSASAGRTSSRS